MPHALAGFLLPVLTGAGLSVAAAAAIALPLAYVLIAGATIGAGLLIGKLAGGGGEVPKPEDGRYNRKQAVPPMPFLLGRGKIGADYVALEEADGVAYHAMVLAAHPVQEFVAHYLHDEAVTLDGDGWVIEPEHFVHEREVDGSTVPTPVVQIKRRTGAAASTAYAEMVSALPSIWTTDHRGDGLTTVMMAAATVPEADFRTVYPQGMPDHMAILRGHSQIYDPRTASYGYTENLALFRLWHLTHPVGAKLTLADMYLPDWINAANVCDQTVTNRSGGSEPRYHGGLWFLSSNSPVSVGALIDQAAELVLYERPDGKIGVHAGEYVEPDIRLTEASIKSVTYDANRRSSSQVLAVRGRWTDPDNGYATADAAIYGDPYVDDTELTKTIENQVVQRHNHCARLQKLKFIRSRAPRVSIVADFDAARDVPYRRFVRVHCPPKLDEAVIEIIGRPTLSLRNLTYSFEGIVVPPSLFSFVAASEEGQPGGAVTPLERNEVPVPSVDTIEVKTEDVLGGSTATFIEVVLNHQNDLFSYQLECTAMPSGAKTSTTAPAGTLTVRTPYLADAAEYVLRIRTWAGGVHSAWVSYPVIIATPAPLLSSSTLLLSSSVWRLSTGG